MDGIASLGSGAKRQRCLHVRTVAGKYFDFQLRAEPLNQPEAAPVLG